jgi:hypothetical protein
VNSVDQHNQQLHDASLLALHYKRLAQMQAEPETVVDHETLEKEMAEKELAFARSNGTRGSIRPPATSLDTAPNADRR